MIDFTSKELSVFLSDTDFRKDIITYLKSNGKIDLAMAGIYHVGIPGKKLKFNLKPDIYTLDITPGDGFINIKNKKGKILHYFSISGNYMYLSYNQFYLTNNLIVTSPELLSECINYYNNKLNDIIDKIKEICNSDINRLNKLIVNI